MYPEYVRAIELYLRYCYEKPSVRFHSYSRPLLDEPDRIEEYLAPMGKRFLKVLLATERITKDFMHNLISDKAAADRMYRFLLLHGCLVRGRRYVTKSSAFNALLNRLVTSGNVPAEGRENLLGGMS